MMLFHGDADANVPYNVIRESGVGFFGSKYIAGQLRAMNSPYYFYSVENASHVIATAPDRQAGPARRYNGNVSRKVASRPSPTVTSNSTSVVPR